MYNFLNLLKIQFISNFKINKILKKKKSSMIGGFSSLVLYVLFLAFIFGCVGYIYTDIAVFSLSVFNKMDETIALMLSYTVLIALFFSFYAVSSVLYSFKDYDMLISMPMKKWQIVLSKLAYTYISDFAISITVMVGVLINYGSFESFGVGLVLKILLFSVVSPFFAITLSVIIGTLFSMIASRFIKKNIVQVILNVVLIVGWFAFSMVMGNENVDMTAMVSKIFFIYPLLVNALNGNLLYLLLYVVACLIPFVVITFLVCTFYEKINGILSAKKTKRNFKLKSYSAKGLMRTMFGKEIKRLFSTPVYAINGLFGTIFGIVFFIALSIIFNSVPLDFSGLFVFAPVMLFFFFGLAPTTNCSVSLEGKAYWVYKTSPISPSIFFGSKLLLFYLINIPAVLICAVTSSILLKIEFLTAFVFVLLGIVSVVFFGLLGLTFDILLPNLKWDSEQQVVKQGIPMLLTMLCTFVFAGGYFVLAFFTEISTLILFLIFLGAFLIFDFALFTLIFKKGQDILDRKI